MTDQPRNAKGHRKGLRFSKHELVQIKRLAAERGQSRSSMLADLTDEFLDGTPVVGDDTHETVFITFSYPEDRAKAAEQKARGLGLSLRDVLRSMVTEQSRG